MAKTILIIEDNDSLRKVYSARLELDGYQVLQATTASQAQDLLQNHLVDILLLDIMLPDKSGLDFLKNLRQNSRFATLPVIMLTQLPDELAFDKSRELFIHGYLIKDQTTLDELSQRIKLALSETSPNQASGEDSPD